MDCQVWKEVHRAPTALHRAFLTVAVGCAALHGVVQAQTSAGASLGTGAFEPGTRIYEVSYDGNPVGRYVHTLLRDSVDGRDVFMVRRSYVAYHQTVRQQAVFDARTFEPVRSWSSGATIVDFAFRDGRVSGTTRPPDGEPRTVELQVPPGTLLPWMFEAAVMTLPLRPGYRTDLGIVTYDGALDTLTLRVTRATTVAVPAGEIEGYEVEVTGANELTLWVRARAPHIVLREDAPDLALLMGLAEIVPPSGSDAAESLAFLPPYHVAGTAPEDTAVMFAVLRSLGEGWGRGDAAAVAAAYSQDAEWTNAFGVVLRGPEEIRDYLEWVFSQDAPGMSAEETVGYRPLSTRYVSSEVAVVHGVTTSRRVGPRSGAGTGVRLVHNTYVLARQPDGGWKIVHHMIMDARGDE